MKSILRNFTANQGKLHLIQQLPFLLTLLSDLKQRLNYKADFKDLLAPASSYVPESDLDKWYEIWCKLDGIWDKSELRYSIRELKPREDLTLFDIAPTNYHSGSEVTYTAIPPNCKSGSTTLNMVKYLSLLQNELVPESTGLKKIPIDKRRYFGYDPRTVLPFLCDDGEHLFSYLHCYLLEHISRLPTDRDEELQSLCSRVLYSDKDMEDFNNIVMFYNSQKNRLELESRDREIIDSLEEQKLWSCHKALTGLMIQLGLNSDFETDIFLETFTFGSEMVELMSQQDKLFAIFRHVNLLCVRSSLSDTADKNFMLSRLLSRVFSSKHYNRPCILPQLTVEEKQLLLLLLAEYVTLQMLGSDHPDYFVGWELGEALELYLENFKERDTDICCFIEDDFQFDNLGYFIGAL